MSAETKAMNGEEAVRRICEQFESEGVDTDSARSLTFVTWEEIIRVVVTSASAAGVLPVEWPASAVPSSGGRG